MAKALNTNSRLPRWAQLTLLGILAATTAGAVMLAASNVNPETVNAGAVHTTPIATPEPEEEPEPSAEPEVAYTAPVMQRLLVAGPEDGHVLRAAIGSCPDPAGGLEVSFDGGATWEAASIASVDARQILQIDASGDETVRMTFRTEACDTAVARSFVGGTSWELDPEQTGIWFIDAADATLIHAPAAAQQIACEAVGLSSEGNRAIALCNNSSVITSEDAGVSWSAPLEVPFVVSVGTASEGFIVASHGEPDCAGVRSRLLSSGAVSAPGACVEAASDAIAVAGSGSTWYLWSGDSFLQSADAGVTWG